MAKFILLPIDNNDIYAYWSQQFAKETING